MDIDNVIAESQAPAEAQVLPDAQAPAEETQTQEQVAETESSNQPKDEPFPKKAQNALSYRDKKIGKLQAQLEQERIARQQLEQQYKQPAPKQSEDGRPKEDDYQRYSDYVEALSEWKADKRVQQALSEFSNKQQTDHRTQQQQAWQSQREEAVASQVQSFVKENPDAIEVIREYADIADEFPPEIQKIFLEADNAPLAFYNLAKEGKLESLIDMSPARAAMEIGRAMTLAVTKTVTKAPTPMSPAKGSAAGTKSVEQMSTESLLKWAQKS